MTRMAGDALKDACWKDYEAIGMKVKDGRKVPNCVPIKKSTDQQQGARS